MLQEFDEEKIEITLENETDANIDKIKIERKNIAQIKTIYHW